MSVRVSDVMTADVITVGPEAFVHKAARLMSDHGVSGLPIVDADSRVIGIVPKAISSSGAPRASRWRRWFFADPEALAREAAGVHAYDLGPFAPPR